MLAITWQFYTFILSTTVVQVLTTYIPTDLSSTSMPMRPRKVVKPTAIRDICFVKPSHGAHTSPTAVNRDAGDLCCFFFELATFAFLSSWQPFNTGDRLLYCTGHGRWIFSCHIQRGNVPRVCWVVVLLSRDKMERANSISIGRLPGWSVDVHPSNGSYPSLPSTTVFRKPIESVRRIFRVAISAASNTTRRRHYVKRLAELTATLGGSGQIFSLEVSSLIA